MNIILIGYRGCGKTSMGKLMAQQLWKTFVDVDREICKAFDGLTVAQIWEKHGEPAFREVEVGITQKLCKQDDQVIALGGGTLMQPGSRKAVEDAQAVRIYLKCDPQELYRRISGDAASAATRPSLTQFGGGVEEIVHMLGVREPVYQAVADHVFDVTHTPVEDAVRYVIERCL